MPVSVTRRPPHNRTAGFLQVEVQLQDAFKRKYRAKGLMPKGPAELEFFNNQENRKMTVAEHYEKQHGHR